MLDNWLHFHTGRLITTPSRKGVQKELGELFPEVLILSIDNFPEQLTTWVMSHVNVHDWFCTYLPALIENHLKPVKRREAQALQVLNATRNVSPERKRQKV